MNETNLLEVGLKVDDADLGLLDALRQRFGPLVRLALLQQFREVIHVLKQKSINSTSNLYCTYCAKYLFMIMSVRNLLNREQITSSSSEICRPTRPTYSHNLF